MIKGKFRDHVRSRSDAGMTNEVLCKILAHNICCLIQSSFELGIQAKFWDDVEVEGDEPESESGAELEFVGAAVDEYLEAMACV